MTNNLKMRSGISGIMIPDSQVARDATQFIRDTESALLFNHSVRVYFWGGLRGQQTGRTFDPELFYVASLFHDLGLTEHYHRSQLRFEVDGANAAREFLRSYALSEIDINTVWTAKSYRALRRDCPEEGRADISSRDSNHERTDHGQKDTLGVGTPGGMRRGSARMLH